MVALFNIMNVQALEYRYISVIKKIKSSLLPKYRQIKNYFSKILLLISFDHKKIFPSYEIRCISDEVIPGSKNKFLNKTLTRKKLSPVYGLITEKWKLFFPSFALDVVL